MAVLAMRLSTHQNAVSQPARRACRGGSGGASRPTCRSRRSRSTPITNGVHAGDLDGARDRARRASPTRPRRWTAASSGRRTRASRARLVAACREKLVEEKRKQGAQEEEIAEAAERARSEGADDRLRPPVRDVQARDAALPRAEAARVPPPPDRPAGADPLRRQGPSARRGRQGVPARRRDARPSGPSSGPRRVPARLRHGARAHARGRLRRLAQHARAAARGVRHLGHEGRDERRPESLGARRLVGRGAARRGRVRRRRGQGPGRRRGDRPGALRRAREAGPSDVLRPRRLGPAAALDRPDDRRRLARGPRVLLGPHGLGVPRAVLRAGRVPPPGDEGRRPGAA